MSLRSGQIDVHLQKRRCLSFCFLNGAYKCLGIFFGLLLLAVSCLITNLPIALATYFFFIIAYVIQAQIMFGDLINPFVFFFHVPIIRYLYIGFRVPLVPCRVRTSGLFFVNLSMGWVVYWA